MGIGAVVLGLVAWVLVAVGFTIRTSHELSAVALMIALSGAAVAWEGRRVEEGVAPGLLALGLLLNVTAMLGAVASIAVEVLRRRAA